MAHDAARRGPLWPAALLMAGALGMLVLAMTGGPAAPPAAAVAGPAGTVDRLEPIVIRPLASYLPRQADAPRPTGLVVPSAGVDTRLLPLGLLPDGAMEVPADAAVAGWYEPGPVPGEPGPAVIAGHVDSKSGPGVFFALRRLQPGDPVTVELDDGERLVFSVTAVEQHPKDGLPVDRIWNDTEQPVLRLVTCGGTFDRATGHYTDNVVVFAELVRSTSPQQALRAGV